MKLNRLNVKQLKDILKNIPDDNEVCIVGEDQQYHIMYVTSMGLLSCEEEEHDVIGFMATSNVNNNIYKETEYCNKLLYNGWEE